MPEKKGEDAKKEVEVPKTATRTPGVLRQLGHSCAVCVRRPSNTVHH